MDWRLDRLRLEGGVWEGHLTGPEGAPPPALAAFVDGHRLDPVAITPATTPGGTGWRVTVALPRALMTDGIRRLAIGLEDAAPLATETLVFGDAVAADLRAELEALRVELDLLKRAFRRHLAESHSAESPSAED